MSIPAPTVRTDGMPWWPAQDADCVFSPGEVLADTYEIRTLLGTGAMGQVFEAYDRVLGRLVAIKAGQPDLRLPPLRNEAQAMAALRHPALVAVYCMGVHKSTEYIVMERVGGKSLEEHLVQRRSTGDPFSIDETIDVVRSVAEGLSAIHAAGIVHRDVKPANIMLAPRNRVVLTDLGAFQRDFDATPSEELVGTPLYIAPETILKNATPGAKHLCDLYAVGVIAYEMLTLKMPFDGHCIVEILRKHLYAPIPDVRRLRPDVPARLARLIADLLRKEPSERPATADAIVWQLRQMRETPEAGARRLSTLIVEDDHAAVTLLSRIMRRLAPTAEIHVASTAEAAIHVVHRKSPALILLDLDLPRMNGVELCMHLRVLHTAERARIVVISGRLADSDRRRLRQIGIRDFIAKGMDVQRLLPRVIEEVCPIPWRSPPVLR